MNPDLPSLPSSPQEERLTALLLGELDPAGAAAVRRWGPGSLRWWLGAQVVVAIGVEAIFRTGW